ncbi:hypothetical protein AB0A91_13200 [Streptomyces sp. NPDC042207]|uniref:hypothetical protein n=1 Tax=Streptomyces sp. NPDC042207 TaxID=3154331 RepID=UPI0033DC8151
MSQQGVSEAREQLEDARRRREEAGALVEALEERVRSGDEEVVAMELGQQYGLARLAELEQERAERRVREAEAEAHRQALDEARRAAGEELSGVSLEVLDGLHRRLLAALDTFVAACQTREAAIGRHAEQLKQLGDRHLWIDTNGAGVALRVGEELYRDGEFEADKLVRRAAGAVLWTRGAFGYKTVFEPPLKHPLDGPSMDELNEDQAARQVNWGSKVFAERMVAHARATVENEEAA